MTAPRKPRVASAEARVVLIEATIELLRELPVFELSTRKIEARSGLDRRAITRQFGGEVELFVATLEELTNRALESLKSLPPDTNHMVDDDLKLRVDLHAFLILSGVPAERLKAIPTSTVGAQMVLERMGISPDTPVEIQEGFLTLMQALILTGTFFGPSSRLDNPENRMTVFMMLQYLASMGPELPERLGLDLGPADS